MRVRKEVLAANAKWAAEFGDESERAPPSARRFAIPTCMDARLDPAKYAGRAEGDAHVIRHAGGRASDDAIRALVISHERPGATERFVVHHADCGMGTFCDESVPKDVQRIRQRPLVPRDMPIYGYVQDAKTGRPNEVAQATQAGKAV